MQHDNSYDKHVKATKLYSHNTSQATFQLSSNIPTLKQHSNPQATFQLSSNIPTLKQHSNSQATFQL
jgi:hypothetical protein